MAFISFHQLFNVGKGVGRVVAVGTAVGTALAGKLTHPRKREELFLRKYENRLRLVYHGDTVLMRREMAQLGLRDAVIHA